MYKYYNPNPTGRTTAGDCAIRAVAKALDIDWESAFAKITVNAFRMGDMPSSDSVWGSVLRMNGFYRENLPCTTRDCYTVREFAMDNPVGTYVVGTGSHVVTIIDGNYYDSWQSGDESVIYFWVK